MTILTSKNGQMASSLEKEPAFNSSGIFYPILSNAIATTGFRHIKGHNSLCICIYSYLSTGPSTTWEILSAIRDYTFYIKWLFTIRQKTSAFFPSLRTKI